MKKIEVKKWRKSPKVGSMFVLMYCWKRVPECLNSKTLECLNETPMCNYASEQSRDKTDFQLTVIKGLWANIYIFTINKGQQICQRSYCAYKKKKKGRPTSF